MLRSFFTNGRMTDKGNCVILNTFKDSYVHVKYTLNGKRCYTTLNIDAKIVRIHERLFLKNGDSINAEYYADLCQYFKG